MVAKKNDLSLNTREQGTMRKNRAVDFGHDTLTTFDLNEAQFKAQVYYEQQRKRELMEIHI